ncbi:MAG: S8 family serine peptidase [Myxococcota bacterium]
MAVSLFSFLALFGMTSVAFGQPEVKPGVVLLKCKEFYEPCDLSDLNKTAGISRIKRLAKTSRLLAGILSEGVTTDQAISTYAKDPRIDYVEPNYLVRAFDLPNDPFFKYQWGLHNTGQTGGTIDSDINAPLAWDLRPNGPNVVIGVIDTGVDYTHLDLANNMWTNSLEIPGNGMDDDDNGYIDDIHGINAATGKGDPMDDNQHGTHVAGIIAAEGNNGLGVSGVLQKAKIITCKCLDENGVGDTASAIVCMDYFAALAARSRNPVKMVATNNSWGGGGMSRAFTDAVRDHQKLGILFVAAAGNIGDNNDAVGSFPANIELSNVISVAASDAQDRLASFSNYGPHSVHVAAPGTDILSTIPGQVYDYLSGTSMAAPFVTGVIGSILATNTDMDWVSIKNLIIAGGTLTEAATDGLISGRRLRMIDQDGRGSLSCNNQVLRRRIQPKSSTLIMRVRQKLPLAMLKINCAKSSQPALSLINTPIQVTHLGLKKDVGVDNLLNDLGQNGDEVAYDGIFSGEFIPALAGTYRLLFPGADSVTVTVLE